MLHLQVESKAPLILPALASLGQDLKKSPIGQKLAFANYPYLCKSLIYNIAFDNKEKYNEEK
ncbi:hypothetical protein [uncultured Gammaproteobacteria bacterium]|nr:hypothetical protein [uncultured Gammaproteobacteria bacterium]CAC9655469.1 hypothetical protein [uncultured Gammaproteobacteria bacterium]CAC9951611.1 hypothetical protein [uncultured Gammaproteobacteria bacterium]CAC9979557.1 hypothetical protein [uncultured Gammaproteobacteria bacterium]SSC11403.1 hypothetical protein BPUTEOSOX_1485 [thiotrophic endosymbiont of Bathymodiolus puteoserpentis (Logatchev)]